MSFPNDNLIRNTLAATAAASGKAIFCFLDSPLDSLCVIDIDTWSQIDIEDIAPGMDVEISDGIDTYDLFGVTDICVYEGEYLKIENEDSLLSNANITIEISQNKFDIQFQDLGEHEDLRKYGVKPEYEKIELPKEDEWYMGVDSSGYYFGEKYED